MAETTGQKLKRKRKARGLTQAQLARHLGCTQQYIVLLEKDLRPIAGEYVLKLAEILGTRPGYWRRDLYPYKPVSSSK